VVGITTMSIYDFLLKENSLELRKGSGLWSAALPASAEEAEEIQEHENITVSCIKNNLEKERKLYEYQYI